MDHHLDVSLMPQPTPAQLRVDLAFPLACTCHPSGMDGLCMTCVWAAEDEAYATRHMSDAAQAEDDSMPWWDDEASADARAEQFMHEDD